MNKTTNFNTSNQTGDIHSLIMDMRAAKLALARKKLKDHQEKKLFSVNKDEECDVKENNDIINLPINNECTAEQNFNLNDSKEHYHEPAPELCMQNVGTESEVLECEGVQSDVNVTEILISNKRNLELQINELQLKLSQLEHNYAIAVNNHNVSNHKINNLEKELVILNNKVMQATQEITSKDSTINEFNHLHSQWGEEKSNLQEQLELTKHILTAKERENDSLHSHVYNLQNQLEVTQLQLQQLTNGENPSQTTTGANSEQIEALLHKISVLDQQLKASQKEREQVNLHYEQYVSELNEQLRSVIKSNEELSQQVHDLSNRETSLIDQISDMEIRMQTICARKESEKKQIPNQVDQTELQKNYIRVQEQLRDLSIQFEELQNQLALRNAEIQELTQKKASDSSHDTISAAKLSADIASDKIAAQRATEQNKKLKQDVQRLEEAFVKMSRDKLELTEKITAEKYLNKELTIKLAEIEEKAQNTSIKLKAKDEEMMRLQSSCRDMERKFEEISNVAGHTLSDSVDQVSNVSDTCGSGHNSDVETIHVHSTDCMDEHSPLMNGNIIRKEDAMCKLQERFLKIMDEVANLSDEKHTLEHIIVQLQNETDTICEYVALYQQQRSLLKKRDEERNAHIKIYQQECDKLKSHIEELTAILTSFANDKELSTYFETESKQNKLQQVMSLLSNVKNNSLLDFNKKNLDFKNFHPCSCCSGQLIDV